jgi:hypothetical protein
MQVPLNLRVVPRGKICFHADALATCRLSSSQPSSSICTGVSVARELLLDVGAADSMSTILYQTMRVLTCLRPPVEFRIYAPTRCSVAYSDSVYAHEDPRKRAIRPAMSPPDPYDALSPRESRVKVRAKGHQHPSLTPQAPARSTLTSINIVVACTSSLMITSALGSAVTISLPYIGKDLNIQKGDLQWVLSAYSISSVSILLSTVSQCLTYLAHRLVSFSFVVDLQTFTGANLSG